MMSISKVRNKSYLFKHLGNQHDSSASVIILCYTLQNYCADTKILHLTYFLFGQNLHLTTNTITKRDNENTAPNSTKKKREQAYI